MKTNSFRPVNVARAVSSAFFILLLILGTTGNVQAAPTLNELRAQQAALQLQVQQAQAAAAAKKSTAADAAAAIADLEDDIAKVTAAIQSTEASISSAEASISDLASRISEKQAAQDAKEEQVRVALRQYMKVQVSRSDINYLSLVFSGDSLSNDISTKRNYVSVKQRAERLQGELAQAQADLQGQKDQQEQKKYDLQDYVEQNKLQKTQLAKQEARQSALKASAEAASVALQQQANQAKAQIAAIEQKIRLLTATKAWGTQIVSSNDSSWYYSQTGNYTHLGKSPYTISEYGCFITSIAMVSTYYGGHVTPDYIAQNGTFDREGYLYSLPPLNITVQGSRPVNWSIVNDEIDNGRPVIVSIYLPSVGQVNSDGSSHFIVIKGHTGSTYLMHDPIGPGRGYNLNQVVSMRLVRSK